MADFETFNAITGCTDAQVAKSYLEMAGNDLETAISIYMDTGGGGGGGGGSGAAPA